jgi:hypothetical protein
MLVVWIRRVVPVAAMGVLALNLSATPSQVSADTPLDAPSQDSDETAAREGDSSIEIQAAPSATFVAPSAAIGDFGANRGNVWDMDSTGDIVWTQSNGSGQTVSLSQLSPGIVRGEVPKGDALAIVFYANGSQNLPSSQYHHLTYRVKIAAEGGCKTDARVIYTKAWPNWLGSQVFTHGFLPHEPPMNCPFGEWCTYYMDLSSNDNDIQGPDTATWFEDPPPWPTDAVKAFGMWPHEWWANCSGGPAYFDIDYVYLTGDIVAREKDGYQYTLKWKVVDPDGGTITSQIRYKEVPELLEPSQAPACDGSNFTTDWTYIGETTTDLSATPSLPNKIFLPLMFGGGGSGGTGAYNTTYDWDLSGSGFEDGLSYYVCVQVDDGTSQRYSVSDAPVIRAPHSPNFGDE